MRLRFLPAAFAASGVLLMTSLAGAIVAPPLQCGTGPECGLGFECAVVGASGCASAPPCMAGAECPAPEPCVATEVLGCVPAHCTSDAQCAAGMVCHAYTEPCPVTDCACGDAPDCTCGVSSCEAVAVSVCTPRYQLPCQTATDCGEGFTCEEQTLGCETAMSGSAGVPMPGADAAPPGGAAGVPSEPAMPVPSCEPQATGVFQCVPKAITCQSAGDCPMGWGCQQTAAVSAPACPPGETCAADPVELPKPQCVPPYYGGVAASDGSVSTPGTVSTPTASPGGGNSGPAAPLPGAAPQAESSDATVHESAACQMGRAPASSGSASLLALAAALLGLKRRRRA